MDTVLEDKILEKPSTITKITPYVFCFFIFSFIGWILETVFCYCVLGKLVKRGFLNSPICPIYRIWSTYTNNLFR